jgi:hypothetical protein
MQSDFMTQPSEGISKATERRKAGLKSDID